MRSEKSRMLREWGRNTVLWTSKGVQWPGWTRVPDIAGRLMILPVGHQVWFEAHSLMLSPWSIRCILTGLVKYHFCLFYLHPKPWPFLSFRSCGQKAENEQTLREQALKMFVICLLDIARTSSGSNNSCYLEKNENPLLKHGLEV